MCCHIEMDVADQTFYLTRSQHTDTGPTSPFANLITPGAWQGTEVGNDLCSTMQTLARFQGQPLGTLLRDGGGAHVRLSERDRLVGLVVKTSASRAEDPGFESRLRRDFSGVESYQ